MKFNQSDVFQFSPETSSYKSYLAAQSLRLRQWSFIGASVLYTLFVVMDFLRFPSEVWSLTIPVRIVFAITPIIFLTVVFNRKKSNDVRSHVSLLVSSYLSIGLTHAFVNYMALIHGIEFPNNGLVLIILFGCLLTAIPIRLAAVTTFFIVAITEVSSVAAGQSVVESATDGMFFFLFGGLCLAVHRICQIVLAQNFGLLRKLHASSVMDELTGLNNRRFFDLEVKRLLQQARRDQKTCGLMILDIDHFKSINDNLGHDAGDRLLRALGAFLQSVCRRPSDFAARYGGDEFVLFFYDIENSMLEKIGHQIVQRVRTIRPFGAASDCIPTVSIGATSSSSHPAELFKAADKALYEAKRKGRDCFQLSSTGGELIDRVFEAQG
ncbi:GGDEF domain-containing protein [Marinobacter apostichopi]|uniref:GGDEF domain-containing protein n=1 Tax=Marinobacter apostichopi TaxID=3035454 RepID=UPI00257425F7|nr:GGDEF domain-containing protein [Marinobacter sp. LA51]